MKNLLFALVLNLSVSAFASEGIVVQSKKVVLPVDVSPSSVIVSNLGYSSFLLKVLVPELADVTLLDHRNFGADAPCLRTTEASLPEDLIQGNPGKEKVEFTIKLERKSVKSPGECSVTMIETVTGKIRGFNFIHTKYADLGSRHLDDCR